MDSLIILILIISWPILAFPATASLFPEGALPTKSGYLPIGTVSGAPSSLFFAFYEAQQPLSSLDQTPLLVWLQGGPGCSSMLGNLFELGPWLVDADASTLRPNSAAWNRRFGLLFIDSPLGTGFSVALSLDSIPRNQSVVAAHLWAALQSFLSTSSFRTRPLYLTGESYAGKYVPAAGYHILQENSRVPPSRRINLGGVAIGNGLTHPVVQVGTHAATAFFSGLINEKQKTYLEGLQDEAINLTLEEKWSQASEARTKVLDWLQNATGLATLYDLSKEKPYQTEIIGAFLNKDEVKGALGISKDVIWDSCSDAVATVLDEDIMKSVKFMVEELIRKSRVLLYQGIYDLRDGVVSTEAWLKELNWNGLDSFLNAERQVWKMDGELAGFAQRSGSLSHVVISGAGHLVPTDQGNRSQAMIENWVLENGLFSDARIEGTTIRKSF